MSTRQPYSYVVLRYVHDVVTGEFVNVGIVMVAPEEGKFLAQTRKTIGRIKSVFPDLDRIAFVEAMQSIDRGISRVRKEVKKEGLFADEKNASAYARLVLPEDDSSLQWSPVASGIATNVEAAFDRLYRRFVSRYDTTPPKRKSDADVWKPVREKLIERGIDLALENKTVTGTNDSIEFSRAWKNGSWHVYEPVSFDLADAEGIRDKARRWRGHLEAVASGTSEDIHLHFLMGRPAKRALLDAYKSAAGILEGAPFDPVVFDETNVDEFVDDIEDEVRAHSGGQNV